MTPSNVYAISPYGPLGASSRVRLCDWFGHLGLAPKYFNYRDEKNNSFRSMIGDPWGTARAEQMIRTLDTGGSTVIMSREASPLSAGRLEARLLRRAGHSVFDFDDALFADTSPWRKATPMKAKTKLSVRSADAVIAGNEYLAEWASTYNHEVHVVPSCIEPAHYQQKNQWGFAGIVPRLVWLGSPATEIYLSKIMPALLEVHRRTGAELQIISGAGNNALLASLAGMLSRVQWSPTTFAHYLGQADIAISPLPDTPYSRGKCAYKMLQYAATGLPMVASPVGANELALKRFDGLPATTHDEWVEALLTLIFAGGDGRRDRAVEGMESVKRHYSFQAWSDVWRSIAHLDPARRDLL